MSTNSSFITRALDNVAYYGDYLWGKSRNYLMPYWSNDYTASQITDDIFISDLPSAFNLEQMHKHGITHVINLILGVDSIYPEEFVYKNIPARDIYRQNISQYFDECIEFMTEAISSGGKVLVHCSQGISRSASIVIAYLIRTEGLKFCEALALVQSKRPIVNPNDSFRLQLLDFEYSCRK